MNIYTTLSFILAATALLATRVAVADSIHIENSIRVHSNTGGNYSRGSSIVTSSTSNRIDIRSVVNGHVVEDIHEATSSNTRYVHEYSTTSPEVRDTSEQSIQQQLHMKETILISTPTVRLISEEYFSDEAPSKVLISIVRILLANFSAYVRNWITR